MGIVLYKESIGIIIASGGFFSMDFLEVLKVVMFGVIQGVTEWLPISSTGHMILFNKFVNLNLSKEFLDLFLVLIQLASTFAVIFLYFRKMNPFKKIKGKLTLNKDALNLWRKIFVGCFPLLLGAFLDDFIHEKLYNCLVISLTLILYGLIFIFIEKSKKKPSVKKLCQIDYKKSLLIGIFQILAIIPGTSRSGATIIGSLSLGCSRFVATEFSFFLAIPTMLGASFYKTLKYILKFGLNFSFYEFFTLLVGFVVSFVVSVFSIKVFTNYIKKHSFLVFGYYRIILGLVLLTYFYVVNPIFLETTSIY